MSHNEYAVGDSFEGSPIELNKWLSPVWAAGGIVKIDGNVAVITYLPSHKPLPTDEDPPLADPALEEAVIEPEKVEPKESVKDATVKNVPSKPNLRTRKPKASSQENE